MSDTTDLKKERAIKTSQMVDIFTDYYLGLNEDEDDGYLKLKAVKSAATITSLIELSKDIDNLVARPNINKVFSDHYSMDKEFYLNFNLKEGPSDTNIITPNLCYIMGKYIYHDNKYDKVSSFIDKKTTQSAQALSVSFFRFLGTSSIILEKDRSSRFFNTNKLARFFNHEFTKDNLAKNALLEVFPKEMAFLEKNILFDKINPENKKQSKKHKI